MKKIAKTIVIFMVILLALLIAPSNKAKAQFRASISIEAFYSELAPYGQWVDDPAYGYIWIPSGGQGFRPYYSQGHWVMTRYGSMWVSDYAWGWAPFHYGRWTYNTYYGWVWIPGTEWGPAWVSWRSGGDYCGWAPLGPGLDVSFSFSSYTIPEDWWVFLPQRYVLHSSFHNYCIPFERNRNYVRTTNFVTNSYVNGNVHYASGPRINDIERSTHTKVPVYDVANLNRPGRTSLQGNAVTTYRPEVAKSFKGNSRQIHPAAITRDQFIKNKEVRSGVNNNGVGKMQQTDQSSRQIDRKPVQFQNKQTNDRQAIPERRQQINQPVQQSERKQFNPANNQQNNDRQVIPGRKQQINQPVQQSERKQFNPANNQQSNDRQVIPERRQQINQPVQQERKQFQPNNQQNNNRQTMPERQMQPRQQPSQTDQKQFQLQNNNRANIPQQQMERRQQVQPQNNNRQDIPRQQISSPQQSNPENKGRGKGHN